MNPWRSTKEKTEFVGNFVRVYEHNGLFRFIVHKNGINTITDDTPYESREEAIDAASRQQELNGDRRNSA